MRTILVNYHVEPEGWTAETPDRPSWTAFGETLAEVRALAEEGLPLVFGERVKLFERFPYTGNFVVIPSFHFSGTSASGPAANVIAPSDLRLIS